MVLYTITNVKVSIKTSKISLNNVLVCNQSYQKNYKNFIVLKDKYTFIIFKTSKAKEENHINITKIPSLEKVEHAVRHFTKIINCEVNKIAVDNIIATVNAGKKLCLASICRSGKFKQVKYNNEKFPGAFLKFDVGTAILFHSGKIVLLGCKSINNIECLIANIFAVI